MNNKLLFIILGGLLAVVIVYAFGIIDVFKGKTTDVSKDDTIKVTASFYPLYYFAGEIAGSKAEITNLTPGGVEPHDYELIPQDIVRIQEGKLLIVNGSGLEPWVGKLQDELRQKGITIVTVTEGIQLQESKEEEFNTDPHVWLNPVLAKSQVDKILQGFMSVDQNNRSSYEANAQKLKQRLDELDKNYKQELASCEQRSFITSHSAFGYLAREYNLTQVPISGLSPDEEPSPAELAEVTKFAKENNVKYIFFETLVSPKLSETIAREVGAQTLVLDPIEGLSDDDIRQGKNYFTVMESNLQNLQTALGCSK